VAEPGGLCSPDALTSVTPMQRAPVIVGATVLLAAVCFATSVLPPHWRKPYISTYWAQSPANVPSLRPEWLVNDATVPLINYSLPQDASSALRELGGGFHPKLYVDVAVFYAYIFLLLLLGFAGTLHVPTRRCLHRRVRVPLRAWALRLLPPWLSPTGSDLAAGFSIGEALVTALTLGLFVWWCWWWSSGFTLLREKLSYDPHATVQVVARVLGHMANLALSLTLFPLARNSVWEAAFGIPFDRAVFYHRVMGRIAWLFVTLHMAVWVGKWAAEGTLLHNLVSTYDIALGGDKRCADAALPCT
jgi:hypothetical protein